jgi:outer membrane receptor protein involved in Fe transport
MRFDAPYAYNTDVMPAVKRLNLFLTSRYELSEGLELFGEAGYYNAETDSIQAPTGTLSSGPIIVPASNYWNPFGPTTLNGAANPNRLAGINAPAGGLPVTISSYNFADAGPNLVNVKNEQFRLLAGLRFEGFGFDWETAGVYSEASVRDSSDGISATLLQRQLALSTPDAYNPFTGGNVADPSGADTTLNSAAALDAIRIKTVRRSKTSLAMWDLKGSRPDLFALPAGDVGLAIGGEVRRETQFDNRDPRVDGTITFTDSVSGFVNGSDLVGSSPSPDTKGKRTVAAAYAEVAVPVISPEMGIPLIYRFDLQMAGRFEHYSDVGSVAKPKVAAAWDVVDGIRFRASYSEGFKAPNLEQLNATLVTRSNTRTDYVRCEADLRAGRITSFSACSQGFATTAQRSGNPDLKPETSKNWTVGVVLQPRFLEDSIGRVVVTADYWNIKQKGIVGLFGEGNALINDYLLRTQGQTDTNVVRADPTQADIDLFAGTGLTPAGRVLFVRDKYVNLLPQEASGIDFGLNWRTPQTGIGRFNLAVNVAYLEKFFLQPSPPIQALLDARAAGEINAGTIIAEQGDLVRRNGKPRWKWNASLTWDITDEVQVGAYTQYTGSVEDTGLRDSACTNWLIDDTLTGNLYVQFKAGDNYRFRVGARNITNEKPPLSSDGYLGSLYNPYGRYWYANVRVGL